MRIATTRSASHSATEAQPAKTAAGPESFFALLANASAQPEIASRVEAAPSAHWKGDPDSDAPAAPEQAQTGAPAGPGAPTKQAQSQAAPSTAVPKSLESCAQSSNCRSAAIHASGRDQQAQTYSDALGPAQISRMVLTPPPASAVPKSAVSSAQPSDSKGEAYRTSGRDQKTQSHSDAPGLVAIPHTVFNALSAIAALPVPVLVPESAAQAQARPILAAANSTDETGKAFAEHAGADAGSTLAPTGSQGKPQASSSPAGDAGATKADAAQQIASADAPQPASITEPALTQTIAMSAVGQSTTVLANIANMPIAGIGDSFAQPGETSQDKGTSVAAPSEAAAPKGLSGVSAAGDAKDKASQPVAGASSAPAQNDSGNNQAVQRPDANHSQADANAPKAANSTSSQMPGIAVQGEPHAAGASSGRADSFPQPAHSSGQAAPAQAPETAAASGVNTASLLQKMSESEMRVAVNSTEFGAISIRTSLSPQQLMTQITVDHGDLGRAMSLHIPAVEAKLGGDLGVRAVVQVNHAGSSFSGNGSNSSQGGQRDFRAAPSGGEMAPALTGSEDPFLHVAVTTADNDRLDIRA